MLSVMVVLIDGKAGRRSTTQKQRFSIQLTEASQYLFSWKKTNEAIADSGRWEWELWRGLPLSMSNNLTLNAWAIARTMKDLVLSLLKTCALSLWRAYNCEWILCAQKGLLHLIGNPGIPSENKTIISIKGGIPDRLKLPIGGSPYLSRGNLKVDRAILYDSSSFRPTIRLNHLAMVTLWLAFAFSLIDQGSSTWKLLLERKNRSVRVGSQGPSQCSREVHCVVRISEKWISKRGKDWRTDRPRV